MTNRFHARQSEPNDGIPMNDDGVQAPDTAAIHSYTESGTERPLNVLFCWSSGKDSALALNELLRSPDRYAVRALLTTVTEDYDRISMHGVRTELLERQAAELKLPLRKVLITKDSSNEEYERRMREALLEFERRDVRTVAFGDIFLEDIRLYRETNLSKLDFTALFPLWKKDTRTLALAFIEAGFKAVVTCVDTRVLDASFAGREFDERFLADLPPAADPCGENGEFHTFVHSGPIFGRPISVRTGEKVLRDDRFCFCDLIPT